jgi:hypothetical protein
VSRVENFAPCELTEVLERPYISVLHHILGLAVILQYRACYAVTVPAKILELWASKDFPMPDKQFQYKAPGKPIPYAELALLSPFLVNSFLFSAMTVGGFVADWKRMHRRRVRSSF